MRWRRLAFVIGWFTGGGWWVSGIGYGYIELFLGGCLEGFVYWRFNYSVFVEFIRWFFGI